MLHYLPRNRKSILMEKLAPLCSEALQKFIDKHELQKNELERYCGLAPCRVSQVLAGTLSESSLVKMLEGGIILTTDIFDKLPLTDDERAYLEPYALAENNYEFAKLVSEASEMGLRDQAKKLLENLIANKK